MKNLIGKPALFAEQSLPFYIQKPAKRILKVLHSALANAENNYRLEKSNLFIKNIIVDEGPSYRRRRPRSKGRAAPIAKKTSHITIVLEEKIKAKVISPAQKAESKPVVSAKKTAVQIKKRGERNKEGKK